MNKFAVNASPKEHELDDQLKSLLNKNLREANENKWFTQRLMNRLPERNHWASASVWQFIFYALGAIAIIIGLYSSGHLVISTGMSLFSVMTAIGISLVILICAAVLTVPALIKILREP